MKGSREDQSILGTWWFTVDRAMLTAILLLMIFGVLMSLAASPLMAAKLGYDPYFFVKRHVIFIIPSVFLFFLVSVLSPLAMRKLSLILLVASVILLIFVLLGDVEINGSRRWLRLAGFSLQTVGIRKTWICGHRCLAVCSIQRTQGYARKRNRNIIALLNLRAANTAT